MHDRTPSWRGERRRRRHLVRWHRGGGANGTAMVRQWMANMGLSVAPGILAVAEATLDDHAQLRGLDRSELAEFVSQAAPLRRAA